MRPEHLNAEQKAKLDYVLETTFFEKEQVINILVGSVDFESFLMQMYSTHVQAATQQAVYGLDTFTPMIPDNMLVTILTDIINGIKEDQAQEQGHPPPYEQPIPPEREEKERDDSYRGFARTPMRTRPIQRRIRPKKNWI